MKLKKNTSIIVALLVGALLYPVGKTVLNGLNSVAMNSWDSITEKNWAKGFEVLQIPSSVDGTMQNAYAWESTRNEPMPLVVSLHTWSGSYRQEDPLSEKIRSAGFHYIHPDFRGSNNTPASCASPLALQDIDDTIDYCIENWRVDAERIYIVGVSGGGHATCATYFHTKHPVSAFFAWVPITDLEAWYLQTKQRGLKYANDIEEICGGSFDPVSARKRSPLYMDLSGRNARLHLFAGINDGYSGSVPIVHSINLYNKLSENSNRIDEQTAIKLISKTVVPSGIQMAGRDVWYQSESPKCTLTIFEGGHEMLVEFAANQIISQARQDAALNVANAP